MSEGGGVDEGNREEDDSMIRVSTTDIERDIEVINKEIQEMSDGACGSIYRCTLGMLKILRRIICTTCYKPSTDHPNGTVKHCKGKKSGLEEYANSLVLQQRALRSHLDLVHSALLNNDSIKLANKKILLQKGILANTQVEAASQINKKYAESTCLLAVA